MKAPATLPLRVTTPEGPALLIAPLQELIRVRAQHWYGQGIAELTAHHTREAEVCHGKAAVLEQLAKDVAEQR